MTMLRRRLAACALALLVCHSTLVFVAPLSSCCPARHAAAEAARTDGELATEKDCCPAGSHAPGQCPLHGRSKTATKVSCRMQCDAPHGVQFLLGASGPLPAPAVSLQPFVVSHVVVLPVDDPEGRPSVPESPPPRLG